MKNENNQIHGKCSKEEILKHSIADIKFCSSKMVDGILSFIEIEINEDLHGKCSKEEILKHSYELFNFLVVSMVDQFTKNGEYVFELISKTDLKKLWVPVLKNTDQDPTNDH